MNPQRPPVRRCLIALASLAAVVALAPACRSRCCQPPASPPVAQAPLSAFDAQVARGQAVYGRTCAECHGAAGQGSPGAPPLVGAGALPLAQPGAKHRTMPFRTAGDVARFALASMPPIGAKPSADDAWAIVAFALKANGVSRADAVGPANADAIVLHP